MNSPNFQWNKDAILRGIVAKMLAFLVAILVLSIIASALLYQRGFTQEQVMDYARSTLVNHPIWVVAGLLASGWGGMIVGRRAPDHELSHALLAGLISGGLSLVAVTTWIQAGGALLTPLAFAAGGWWQKQESQKEPPLPKRRTPPQDKPTSTSDKPEDPPSSPPLSGA